MNETIVFAIILSLLAGLSTVIGSFLSFFIKNNNYKFLSFILAFSAGVMILLSLTELIVESNMFLKYDFNNIVAIIMTFLFFLIGIILIYILNKIIPENNFTDKEGKLIRIGIFTCIALAIHNFPEGILTFTSTIKDYSLGILITISIALHNIPEGIAISMPIYYGTKKRKKAFFYSFIAGLFEPLGAILTFLILMPFLNSTIFGIVFAIVAGIMTYISMFEIFPNAFKYNKKMSLLGFVIGLIFMYLSINFLK